MTWYITTSRRYLQAKMVCPLPAASKLRSWEAGARDCCLLAESGNYDSAASKDTGVGCVRMAADKRPIV